MGTEPREREPWEDNDPKVKVSPEFMKLVFGMMVVIFIAVVFQTGVRINSIMNGIGISILSLILNRTLFTIARQADFSLTPQFQEAIPYIIFVVAVIVALATYLLTHDGYMAISSTFLPVVLFLLQWIAT